MKSNSTKCVVNACTLLSACLLVVLWSSFCHAHGVAGKRFFPTTLSVDDPFVSDEFSFITNNIREPDQQTNELSFAFAKRITKDFGIEVAETYRFVKPNGEMRRSGFGNLEVGAKYQFLTSDIHETILSFGLNTEIGGTGAASVGADSFSTFSPTFFFGKGFGDLPDSVKYLKPFALTGALGPSIPSRAQNVTLSVDPDTGDINRDAEQNPDKFNFGFTIQYSLQYLQTYVSDVGLGSPFNRMILLVEFPFETGLDRGSRGKTTGFVNPGLVWFGKHMQLGIEARIPYNSETGNHVGVIGLVHFFLDDLFPQSLGRPLFK